MLKARGKKIIDRKVKPYRDGIFKYTIMTNAVDIDRIHLHAFEKSIELMTCSPAGFERGYYKLKYKDIDTILTAIEALWKTNDSFEYKFKSGNKEIIIKSVKSNYYEVEDNRLMYMTINGKCMIYALDKYDSRRFYAMLKELEQYRKTCRLRRI